MLTDIVVYSVVTDPRFRLEPPSSNQNLEHICFYAGEKPHAPGWKLVRFNPPDELCASRASRIPKTMPHRFLEEYEFSIYADASVCVKTESSDFLVNELVSRQIALIRRPFSLNEEFQRVESRRYDDLYTLRAQKSCYISAAFDLSLTPTYWGGLILRKHHEPPVVHFGERWMLNILRFSRRDQLSLPIALRGISDENLAIIPGDDNSSKLHIRLPGIAKESDYLAGDRLFLSYSGNRDRERWLVDEVSSLRSLVRNRTISTLRSPDYWRAAIYRLLRKLS